MTEGVPSSKRQRSVWATVAIILGVLAACWLVFIPTGLALRLVSRIGPPIAGQEARLVVDSGGNALVSRDLSVFEVVSTTKTTADLAKLLADGSIFLVPSGTRVKVLDDNVRHYQVQILEGDHADSTGYVPAAFVQH